MILEFFFGIMVGAIRSEKGREIHSNNPWDGSYTVVCHLSSVCTVSNHMSTCSIALRRSVRTLVVMALVESSVQWVLRTCWGGGLILSPIFTHHRDGCGYLFRAIFTVIESNLCTTVFCIRSYLSFVFHIYTSQIYLFFATHWTVFNEHLHCVFNTHAGNAKVINTISLSRYAEQYASCYLAWVFLKYLCICVSVYWVLYCVSVFVFQYFSTCPWHGVGIICQREAHSIQARLPSHLNMAQLTCSGQLNAPTTQSLVRPTQFSLSLKWDKYQSWMSWKSWMSFVTSTML